jgi:hypothetical protein
VVVLLGRFDSNHLRFDFKFSNSKNSPAPKRAHLPPQHRVDVFMTNKSNQQTMRSSSPLGYSRSRMEQNTLSAGEGPEGVEPRRSSLSLRPFVATLFVTPRGTCKSSTKAEVLSEKDTPPVSLQAALEERNRYPKSGPYFMQIPLGTNPGQDAQKRKTETRKDKRIIFTPRQPSELKPVIQMEGAKGNG